jgi:hypothetical protein
MSNCQLPHAQPKTPTTGTLLCPGHHKWLTHTLEDIAQTTTLLPYFIEPGSTPETNETRHKRGIDPAAPIRLEIVALLDHRTTTRTPDDLTPVLAILTAWAQLIREEKNLTKPKTPDTITTTTNLIHTHLPWITTQDFITDLAHELRQIKTALHSAIGDHAPRPVGTCPIHHPETGECGGKLYQDRYGRMSVTCRKCGETWGETELRRLGLMQNAT